MCCADRVEELAVEQREDVTQREHHLTVVHAPELRGGGGGGGRVRGRVERPCCRKVLPGLARVCSRVRAFVHL